MKTFTGREYLKIDIASSFGLDKETWENRIKWFDDNETKLDQLVNQAEEPALFFAGVQAWKDVKAGLPIGYMISLDATSSGLQILAALTGDRSAAELCNVVDTGERKDAYTEIFMAMQNTVGMSARIKRDDTKQAIMTSLYGSTAVPKQVFGEGPMLTVFYDTMEEMAPGAWELNEAMLQFWNPETLSHDWEMPDNFQVRTKVMDTETSIVHFLGEPYQITKRVNKPMESGRALGANVVHSIDGMIVRELTRRCDYDVDQIGLVRNLCDNPLSCGNEAITDNDNLVITLWDHYQRSGYLSSRILDHLNANNFGHVNPTVIREMLDALPAKPFKLVSIHDCFRCLPHYANDLRRQYNLQLQLIARSRLLEYLIAQLVGKPVQIDKLDANMWRDVGTTDYALS